MIPRLYESTETGFTSGGICSFFEAESCFVTEARNGIYELEMRYPVSGTFFNEITPDRIILAKPSDKAGSASFLETQPFRIYRVSRPLSGMVTVNAEHWSYQLNRLVTMPFTETDCAGALRALQENAATNCPFIFTTDKDIAAKFKQKVPASIRSVLGGHEGSILDVYGKGEYEFDRFVVTLHTNRGTATDATLRYGKNLTSFDSSVSMENVYTGICPYWAQEDEVVTLPEKVILSRYTGRFANPLIKAVDFTEKFEEAPTVTALRSAAERYVLDNEGWELTDNLKISFVPLWQTDQYRELEEIEHIGLCDTVPVVVPHLGISLPAVKVVKTKYDVLKERYEEIELGELPTNLG